MCIYICLENYYLFTVRAMPLAVALFSVVILANGLSASPQQSRPYFGLDFTLALDFDPRCSPALPPLRDVLDIDIVSLFPASQ